MTSLLVDLPQPNLYHVDAFTREPFRGNSAAIMVIDRGFEIPADDWLQSLAAEMNLAETAFVADRPDGDWDLRWFTPTVEVRLCGHATLASAHVLWSSGRLPRDAQARFQTRQSGLLTATNTIDTSHATGKIELALPMLEATAAPLPDVVRTALGLTDAATVFTGHHPYEYRLIVLRSETELQALTPDFAPLRSRDESYAVTAPSDDPAFDFVSRYFAPGHGIDEDPVTGSAHCVYAPYWCASLAKPIVIGKQISKRTGVVECEPVGDQVLLRGHAFTIFEGTIEY